MCLYSAAVAGIIMLLPEILQLPSTRFFGGEKANNMRSIVKEGWKTVHKILKVVGGDTQEVA